MAPELFIKAATAIWQKCWSDIGAVYLYVTVLAVILSVWTCASDSYMLSGSYLYIKPEFKKQCRFKRTACYSSVDLMAAIHQKSFFSF
jgi:hypothetical protein